MTDSPAPFDVEALLARLPTDPGVYLMKDARGKVVYVGKAKDLRARVRQYFRVGGDARFFVAAGLLRRALADIETVVVANEKEALLLENHLIKQHQPRFNVNLRDDKQYIVLRIDPGKPYPRVEVARNIKKDGARYFGPYHSASSARETLRFVNRHFQLRTCTDHVLATRKRVCLQYQIKRCPGPCVYEVDRDDYAEQVADVMLFLQGKNRELVPRLRERMAERAEREEFEAAAQLRDGIAALENSLAIQHVVQEAQIDQDVWGLYREGDAAQAVVLFVRDGKLMGRRSFYAREQELPDDDVVTGFVQQYYALGSLVPDEVLVPRALDAEATLGEWLTGLRGKRTSLLAPQRGQRRRLVELAEKNAASVFASRGRRDEDAQLALAKLQERLGLKRYPERIECYDIAHIQGASTVASMVVFVDGVPAKAEYRKFKIKSAGNDDFASMYEVLTRRFKRAVGDDPRWVAPDLVVIDGGKGQLGMAVAAMDDLGVGDVDVVGLAKERDDDRPDRVFVRGAKDAIRVRANTAELFLLSRLRDEAHRFANTYHRQTRTKSALRSRLDDIPGIGPVRRKLLLRHFGSVNAIKAASADELALVPGMTAASAQAVYGHFAPEAATDARAADAREDAASAPDPTEAR